MSANKEIIKFRYGEIATFGENDLISRAILYYGEWAQNELNVISKFIKEGDCVLDIGAYIGTHSLAFSKFVSNKGMVFSFEPRKLAFEKLAINRKYAGLRNIQIFNCAIGRYKKKICVDSRLEEGFNNYGALNLSYSGCPEKCEQINIKRLDSFAFKKVDFIKVDVEGMEIDVLHGAHDLIINHSPKIFLECNSVAAGANVCEWAKTNGYLVYGLLSRAFNDDNFLSNNENFFGDAAELGLLLLPKNMEVSLCQQGLYLIKCLDDLVLLLLHKPQYSYEVLGTSYNVNQLSLYYPSPLSVEFENTLAQRDQDLEALNAIVAQRDQDLEALNAIVAQRDQDLEALNAIVAQRDQDLEALNAIVAQRDQDLEVSKKIRLKERLELIEDFQKSYSWRVTAPIRYFAEYFRKKYHQLNNIFIKAGAQIPLLIFYFKKSFILIKNGDWDILLFKLKMKFKSSGDLNGNNHSKFHPLRKAQNRSTSGWQNRETIDIIVPVFNGYELFAVLFESIRSNTSKPYRLIIIDDCSDDQRLKNFLKEITSNYTNVLIFENENNLGFIASVNKGFCEVRSDLFVLLNSDVEVPPDWLERLLEPLHQDSLIASVTPFSNSATICSFPNFNEDNELISGLELHQIDQVFESLPCYDERILIPTGVGFCMAFRSAFIRRFGFFDAIYGRGYAEENDWCMRLSREGYKHVLAENLFVYHKHGGTFAPDEKRRLINKNHRVLLSRYPDYDTKIYEYITSDPASLLRDFLIFKIEAKFFSNNQAVLVIDHDLGGGANDYTREKIAEYTIKKVPVIVLIERQGQAYLSMIANTIKKALPPIEIDELEILFSQIQINKVVYNNLVSSLRPLRILKKIIELRSLYQFSISSLFHDFFPICPSYTLINDSGVYCGVPPDLTTCEKCLPKIKPNYSSLVRASENIRQWRASWLEFLEASDEIIAFSNNSREIISLAYPGIAEKITVRKHQPNLAAFRRVNISPSLRTPHIGIVGGINYAKGLNVIFDILKAAKSRQIDDLKITVIGSIDCVIPIEGLEVTGRYKRESLPDLVEELGINLFMFPSIWPETYSYVTDELIAMGLPIIGFDIGASAERIKKYRYGFIIKTNSSGEELLNKIYDCYREMYPQ